MKKSLLFIIFVGINNFCFAEEENKEVMPKSIIGASFGLQHTKEDYKIGYNAEVFYRHYITSASSFLYDKLYLSLDAGYTHYKGKNNDIVRKDIPITLGLIAYNFFIHSYFGIGFGALHRTEEKTFNESIDDVKMLGYIMSGFSLAATKSLSININIKAHCIIKEKPKGKYGIGLSYSF